MSINKAKREAVYRKYDGRCAYCGREIAYKNMQVDHFIPKHAYSEHGSDDITNLMPSCRMCNHYKRATPLDLWRTFIEEIPGKLSNTSYIYKVGVAYGLIEEHEHPVTFYFEEVKREKANPPKEKI